MYGLVNRAIKGCVVAQFGEPTWQKIENQSQTDASHYVTMNSYPDELTFRIIGVACEVLQVDTKTLLQTFGRHWVMHTATREYHHLMEFSGADLRTFLTNLDQMHEQVAVTFQNLRQPSFALEERDGETFLHYRSERVGLTDFVIGLLDGLAEHFNEPLKVSLVSSRAEGADHDIFRLQF
ncbi:MAG: heme NO-binding domain-containing protein [Nannocystaceae bacterium]